MVTEARLEFEEEKEKLSERQSALNSFQTIGFKGRTFVNQLLPERYEQQKSLKQAQEEYKKAEAKSITERETELSTYEKNVLVPYEKKVEMYEGVVAILQRQAQGKSGNFYGEPEKQQLANQILAENPEFAKAVKAGREARSYARSQGYANIEAYKEALAMKEYFNTQWAKGLDTPATVISRVSTLEPTKVSSISEKSTESNVFNIASSKTDSSSLFAFGYERPEVKESGVLFVTPEEAKSLSKSTFSSYWTLESKDIDSAIQEASFASGVSQRSGAFGLINTRGQFEFNRQQIEARKDLFSQYTNLIEDFKSSPESYKGKVGVNVEQVSGGEQISLTSEFFESNIDTQKAYSNALSKAKTQYGNLPSSEQKKTIRRRCRSWSGTSRSRCFRISSNAFRKFGSTKNRL